MKYSKINNEYRITNEQIIVSLVTVRGGFFLFLEGSKDPGSLPEVADTIMKIFSADGDRVFSIDESKSFTEVMRDLGYPPPGTYMLTSKPVKIKDLTSKQVKFLLEVSPQAELIRGNKQVFIPRQSIDDIFANVGICFDVESTAQTQIYSSGAPVLGHEVETDQKFLDIELCKAASQGDIARIEQCLGDGADINCKECISPVSFFSATKKTPIMYAAEKGKLDTVKYLVKNKARTNIKVGLLSPITALTLAKENKHKNVEEFLVQCETLPLVIHWDELNYNAFPIEGPAMQLLEYLEKIISFIKEHEEQYNVLTGSDAETITQQIRESLFLVVKYIYMSSNEQSYSWLKTNAAALSQRLAFWYWLDLKFNSYDSENESNKATLKNYFVTGSYLTLISSQRNPNYSWTLMLLALAGGVAAASITTYSAIENNEIDFLLTGSIAAFITKDLYDYAEDFKLSKQVKKLIKGWQQEKLEPIIIENDIEALEKIWTKFQNQNESLLNEQKYESSVVCNV
jgi:hypothetical protein